MNIEEEVNYRRSEENRRTWCLFFATMFFTFFFAGFGMVIVMVWLGFVDPWFKITFTCTLISFFCLWMFTIGKEKEQKELE